MSVVLTFIADGHGHIHRPPEAIQMEQATYNQVRTARPNISILLHYRV